MIRNMVQHEKVAAAIALIVAATSSLLAQGITTGAISARSSARKVRRSQEQTSLPCTSQANHDVRDEQPRERPVRDPERPRRRPVHVTVSIIGYRKATGEHVFTIVSQTTEVDFTVVEEAVQASEMGHHGRTAVGLNPHGRARTNMIRSHSGLLDDFRQVSGLVRLTPESRANASYGGDSYIGQDSRYNTTRRSTARTFNNSFGLRAGGWERTGVAADFNWTRSSRCR